jgi:hypothetical protein
MIETPPTPGPAPDAPTPGGFSPTSEERTMAMLAHLLALSGYVIPFGNLIGPLIIWLVKKDTSPFVDDQGKESLNFQITYTIAILICVPLMFCVIGIPLAILLAIAALIFIILASINASGGTPYRYPMTLRLIK